MRRPSARPKQRRQQPVELAATLPAAPVLSRLTRRRSRTAPSACGAMRGKLFTASGALIAAEVRTLSL